MPYISGGGITEKLHGMRGFSAKKFQDIPGQNEKNSRTFQDKMKKIPGHFRFSECFLNGDNGLIPQVHEGILMFRP